MPVVSGTWSGLRSEIRALRAITARAGPREALRTRISHHAGTREVAARVEEQDRRAARLEDELARARALLDDQAARLAELGHRHEALSAATEQARLSALVAATEPVLAAAQEGRETLVTVVLPTLDRPEHLRRAIASVLAQTHERWELLVVDNGGVAATAHVVAGFADPRVRLLESRPPGSGRARNAGLEAAQGSLVAYLDDDNVLFPGWLRAVAVSAARAPQAFAFQGVVVHDRPPEPAYLGLAPAHEAALREHNPTDTGTLAHRHPSALRWSEDPVVLPDWELVARLVARGDAPQPVAARALVYTTAAPGRQCAADDMPGRIEHTQRCVAAVLDPSHRPPENP